MKHIITTLSLLLLLAMAGKATAQGYQSISKDFAPLGAEWYFDYHCFWQEGYICIASIQDTIINGINCHKLEKTRHVHNYLTQEDNEYFLGTEYLYLQDDSVMIYRDGRFWKLFDFGAEIGDSWNVPYTYGTNSDPMGTVEVVGTGEDYYNGAFLRFIELEDAENSSWGFGYHSVGPVRVFERIGAVNSYLFPENLTIPDSNEGGLPRCYLDNELGTIHFNNNQECDFVYTQLSDIPDDNEVSIYPNPTRGEIHLQFPVREDFYVEVFDTKGTLVEKSLGHNGNAVINLESFPVGLYIIKFQSISLINYFAICKF